HVAAEPREPLDAEREIELQCLLETLLLGIGEYAVGQRFRFCRRQIGPFEAFEMAVHAHLWRCSEWEVQVRSIELHGLFQQLGQRHFTVSLTTSSIVVTPSLTLRNPLPRSVIIPSSTALRRSSSADAPTRINSRNSSVTSMTSYNPTR